MSMRRALVLSIVAIGLGTQAAPALAGTVYSNDFTTAVGPNWSSQTAIITTPSGQKALGPLANDTENLTLTGLPDHSAVTVSFDLYALKSWDGNGPSEGPDLWTAGITGGPTLVPQTTFGHPGCEGADQSFPDAFPASHPPNTGAAAVDTLGFGTGCFGDSTYHFSFTFPHTASSLQLSATGSGLQGWDDEGWALDNVVVSVTPLNAFPVTSVDPGSGGQNGTRSIVIRGSGFTPDAVPSFSGTGIDVLSTTWKSATRLGAQIAIDPLAPLGARDVTVTNGDGSSGTCAECFVVDAAPSPLSATPSRLTRGTTLDVDVLGMNFQPGAEVKPIPGEYGVSVNSTTYVSPGDLKANVTVARDAAARRVALKVIDPDGGRGTCPPTCLVIVP